MGAQFACGNHLEAVAEFFCPQCDKHLCKQCSEHKWMANGFEDQCRACQALLQVIGANQVTAPDAKKAGNPNRPMPGPQAFLERVPDIVAYPFKASVVITLLGLALLTTPLMWATGNNISGILGLVGYFVILGLEIMIYFTMVMRTAHGEEEMESPDFDNMFDDFFAPIGRYILALSPIILGMFIYGQSQFGDVLIGVFVLVVEPTRVFDAPIAAVFFCGGILLLPLLTAVAAIGQSALAVLNPTLWAQSLRVMWSTYPIAAAGFYGVLAFQFLWFNEFLLLTLWPAIPIPLLGPLLIVAISYIPMALRARILGAMCQPYLGDFE